MGAYLFDLYHRSIILQTIYIYIYLYAVNRESLYRIRRVFDVKKTKPNQTKKELPENIDSTTIVERD